MAGTNRLSIDPFNQSANITMETLAALRANASRNLETSVITDIGDRRSMDFDISHHSTLPSLSFADQLQSARQSLALSVFDGTMEYGTDDSASEFTPDFTRTHFRLLLDDDPGWKATEPLFNDFLRFSLLFTGQQQVFELLKHYEELCLDQITILRKIIERGAPGKQKFQRTVQMLRYMEAELWTWRLIRTLYQDRLDRKPNEKLAEMSEDEICSLSDLDKWKYLYETNDRFREMRLVVQWCQQNASDLLGFQDIGNIFEDKTFLWENTLYTLKSARATTARKIIKSMDPDAPIRENANLDDTDKTDEQRLLTLVFCYIRAGHLDKAVDLCVNSGEAWRAATLKSALPYHQDSSNNGNSVGNSSRDIWKRMAWRCCEKKSLSTVETAIYGSLSGHFEAMRSSCISWEDVLWAHTVAASEYMFDDFLRRAPSNKKPKLAELTESSTVNKEAGELALDEILHHLGQSNVEAISEESKSVFRRLQSFVFLNDPARAIEYMHQYLAEQGEEAPKHLVRMMAHIALVFKLLALDVPILSTSSILEHYVKLLIEDQRSELVAYYAATLPPATQTAWYAKFLEDVDAKDKRLHLLSLADKAQLDVRSICLRVVSNIKLAYEPGNQSFTSSTSASGVEEGLSDQTTLASAAIVADVSEKDHRLVNAVEWLLFDSGLHGEAVEQANSIARIFLIGRNLAAVQKLFASLPGDILHSAADSWLIADNKDDEMENPQLSLERQNEIREFQCHQAYLEAHVMFRRWFEHYHRKKPLPSVSMGVDSDTTSGAAQFQKRAKAEANNRQYVEKTKEWERDLQALTEDAAQALGYILLYLDGGWMVDRSVASDESMEQSRSEELALIRKRCLPLVTDMLVTVLRGSRRYQDALKVVDIIVAEENGLYQTFTNDQLKNLNRRVAEVSKEALNNGCDLLGYK